MRPTYASLREAKLERAVRDMNVSTDDNYLMKALLAAAEGIDRLCGMAFYPEKAVRYYDADQNNWYINGRELYLGYPLLAATAITDGTGGVLVAGTDYHLLPDGSGPCFYVRLLATSQASWTLYSGNPERAISVAGVWGYHQHYDRAWVNSLDTVQDEDGITAGATGITVADVDGNDADWNAPRFSPGMLLKIDDEMLLLINADNNTQTLTVQRGFGGTVADEHEKGAVIYIWSADETIKRVCARWANAMLQMRGNFETVRYDGVATTAYPDGVPGGIIDELEKASLLASVRRPLFPL